MTPQTKVALLLIVLNVLSFLQFGWDKYRAREGRPRTPNSWLLVVSAYGVIGALLGMYVFRHKTQQPLFKYGVPIILVLEIALALFITHMLYGWPV